MHKLLENDILVSTQKMIGVKSRVDVIQWDEILTNQIISEPVFDARGNQIPERQNIVNSAGESLAIMQGRFSLTTPETFKGIVRDAIGDLPHEIAFSGTLGNQRVSLVGVKFSDVPDFTIGNNDVHSYFHIFGFGVDGTMAKFAGGLLERLFCYNQVAGSMKSGESAKNTANGEAKYQSIVSQLPTILALTNQSKQAFENMANERIAKETAKNFITGLLAPATAKEISAQLETLVSDTFNKFNAGIMAFGETRFDLFNGISEQFTHQANKNSNGIFASSVMGRGAEIKREAMRALNPSNGNQFAEIVARGRSLVTAS